MSTNDGEFTMELFGIDDPGDEANELTAEDISAEELEARLQTATEEEINSYNDDGIIPPLRESANAHIPTEPTDEKPAKKERKKRQPKQVEADELFRLPGGKGLRSELQKAGLTEMDAIGEIQSNQIPSTEGYLSWAEVVSVLRDAGISESTFKRANGGNRALFPPIDPCFRIFWSGKRKYFRPTACDERAIGLLRKMVEETSARKASKPKKERKAKAKADAIPQEVANPTETVADLQKSTLVSWLKNALPDANVSKNLSKAQLLTLVEEAGLTMKDYLAQS